jgi:NADPH:quinone reductase-like Zn-dependent oxidoreductase
LVQVHAASFTPTEMGWTSTWVDRAGKDRRPVIPAHEVSGVVTALGYGATGVAIGDAVYGLTDWYRDGAAAEYVAVEARNLAPKPATLDHREAAAIPMAGLTAIQALFDHGRLAAGQTVLILGPVAASVHSPCSLRAPRAPGSWRADGRGRASSCSGSGRTLSSTPIATTSRRPARDASLVFDLVGGQAFARSWSSLRDDAVAVSVVDEPPVRTDGRGPRGVFFVVEPNRTQLSDLGRRLAAREPAAPSSVRSCRSPKAVRAFAAKRARPQLRPGKIVLQVAAESAVTGRPHGGRGTG